LLPGVQDIDDLHRVSADTIHHYVIGMSHKFAGAGNPARPIQIRVLESGKIIPVIAASDSRGIPKQLGF
jgi:hypothetical protein